MLGVTMDKFPTACNAHEATLYLNWVRWACGMMGPGDVIFAQHGAAIRRVARALWDENRLWRGKQLVYRGVRLADPGLDGRAMPRYSGRDGATQYTFSFTEDVDVACLFADPGPDGFPATWDLPPHGYVLEARIPGSEVLFHWKYLDRYPVFRERVFDNGPGFKLPDGRVMAPPTVAFLAAQKEVTVLNSPLLIQIARKFPERFPNYRPTERTRRLCEGETP